jgi:hypothetical protein
MNFGADRFMEGYLFNCRNISADVLGQTYLRNVYAVFDGTNKTPRLGVVKRPFGVI